MQQSGYCPRGAFCAFAHLDGNSESLNINFYLVKIVGYYFFICAVDILCEY